MKQIFRGRLYFAIFLFVAALALASCNDNGDGLEDNIYGFYTVDIPTTKNPDLKSDELVINSNINAIGSKTLSRALQSGNFNDGISISPLSIAVAVSMRANMSNEADELQILYKILNYDKNLDYINSTLSKLIRFLPDKSNIADVKISNSIWLRGKTYDNINDREKQFVDSYSAEVYSFGDDDFYFMKRIREWIKLRTKGLIGDDYDLPVDPQSSLTAVNALYFKGEWETKFDKAETRSEKFTASGAEVDVNMMHGLVENVTYCISPNFHAIKLPFKGNYDMVLILPAQGYSLEKLTGLLSGEWQLIDTAGYMIGTGHLNISLPKFKEKNTVSLNDLLGVDRCFDVAQSSYIEVDEDGATAAAGTIVQDSAPMDLEFNRPFLYSIVNRVSHTCLMMGYISNPCL